MSRYKYLPSSLAEALMNLGISVRRPVPPGSQVGLHRSPYHGASIDSAEYRPYTPGDPTEPHRLARVCQDRQVHDPAMLRGNESARHDPARHLRKPGLPRRGADDEDGIRMLPGGGLMYMLVNQRDAVGLMTFDSRLTKGFPPVGTSEGLRPMLEHLETLQPSGRSDIEAAFTRPRPGSVPRAWSSSFPISCRTRRDPAGRPAPLP